MYNEHELLLAYLAGIVDGEGYVGIEKKGGLYGPRLQVGMTDKNVIDLLADTFGGRIYVDKLKSGRFIYRWHVTKKDTVEATLQALLPYLRVKYKQAEYVLEFVRGYTAHAHQPLTTPEEMERRQALYTKVKPLNAVGAKALVQLN